MFHSNTASSKDTFYRLQQPGSGTQYDPVAGLTASGSDANISTTILDLVDDLADGEALQLRCMVKSHADWYSRASSPFVSTFDDLSTAQSWAERMETYRAKYGPAEGEICLAEIKPGLLPSGTMHYVLFRDLINQAGANVDNRAKNGYEYVFIGGIPAEAISWYGPVNDYQNYLNTIQSDDLTELFASLRVHSDSERETDSDPTQRAATVRAPTINSTSSWRENDDEEAGEFFEELYYSFTNHTPAYSGRWSPKTAMIMAIEDERDFEVKVADQLGWSLELCPECGKTVDEDCYVNQHFRWCVDCEIPIWHDYGDDLHEGSSKGHDDCQVAEFSGSCEAYRRKTWENEITESIWRAMAKDD